LAIPATRHQLERVIDLQRALDEGLFIESRKVGDNHPSDRAGNRRAE
jgi:hypothetical protein